MNEQRFWGLLGIVVFAVVISGCTLFGPGKVNVGGTVSYENGTAAAGVQVTLGNQKVDTSQHGNFYFSNVPVGSHNLVVSIDGEQVHTQKVSVEKNPKAIRIMIPDTHIPVQVGSMSGRVVLAGDGAVVGAKVKVGGKEATTDATGYYRISELAYGSHAITVTVDGEAANVTPDSVTIAAASTTQDLAISIPDPTVTITGTVRDQDDDVVVGAEVTVGDKTATTDADGKFSIADMLYDTYAVSVKVDGEDVDVSPNSITVDAATAVFNFGVIIPEPTPLTFCTAAAGFDTSGMKMAFCEDFSGPGTDPADFDFAIHVGGDWSVSTDADGTRWLQGSHGAVANAWIAVPDMGPAEKVIIEYDHNQISGYSGFIFKASDPKTSQGREAFFGFHHFGHSMRPVTGNQTPAADHINGTSAGIGNEGTRTMRIEYDKGTFRLYHDGNLVSPYPATVDPKYDYTSADHKHIMLYLGAGAAAGFTNIRVWVEE